MGKMTADDKADKAAMKDMGDESYLRPPSKGPKAGVYRGNVKKKADGGMTKYKKGGMPDLTGDGKVTRADVLKGRGVFKKGGKVPKGMHRMPDGSLMKDSAHKKSVKKMGGGATKSYAMGGKVDGCAVRGKTRGRTV